MPPADDDRPSDPAPFESFGEELTVRDLQVNADDITLDETQAAAARAGEMNEKDRSRVVARPAAPRDADDADLEALDAFTVEVDCELGSWEETEEATVHLTDHQLSKLRAAAASDDSDVYGGEKPPPAAPEDPASLPLPPVLDPDLG